MIFTEKEEKEVLKNGEFLFTLQTDYDERKSFYEKAKVIRYNNAIYLQSYDTIVARIKNGKVFVRGWYSQTTARHINEFLLQNAYSKMTKAEMNLGQEWAI